MSEDRRTEFLNNIQNKEYFVRDVQSELRNRAMQELESMKKEMASDFIKNSNNK